MEHVEDALLKMCDYAVYVIMSYFLEEKPTNKKLWSNYGRVRLTLFWIKNKRNNLQIFL